MGATPFQDWTTTPEPDCDRAFKRLQAEARHECGHGGYTGTIAEKPGYAVVQREPVSLREAMDYSQRMIEAAEEYDGHPLEWINDKWAPAAAVALGDDGRTVTGWLFFGWASE